MTAATITIRDDDVDGALQRLYDAAGSLGPVLKNIGEYETSSTKRRFLDEQDPDGRPWLELNTLYAKTKKGPGKLRGQSRSLSEIVYQVAEDSVEIGTNAIYARIHNEGGTIKPKSAGALLFSMGGQTFMVQQVKIPKRQFLGVNETDREEIMEIILDHFRDSVEQP